MLRLAARGIKRSAGPATFFGCGYCYHVTQSRSETAPQLAALSVAGAMSHVFHSLRSVAPELPEDSWPREKIKDVERLELQLLMEAVHKCEQKGLDCTELRHLALEHVCLTVAQTPGAMAELPVIQALDGGMSELLGFVDRMVTALAAEGFADLSDDSKTLTALTAVLRNVVESPSWHESLAPETILKVARTACIATQWCALWGQRATVDGRIVGMAPLDFPVEEQQTVVSGLQTIWKALSEGAPAEVLRSRPTSTEASELQKELQTRYRAIERPPQPPAILFAAPVLLAALKQPLAEALCHRSHAAPPCCSVKKAEAKIEGSAVKKSSDAKASGGLISSTVNALRWTFLAAIAVGALSQDGFGLLNFHVLPTPVKDLLWDVMRAQVAKVDMQLSRAAPPKYLDELPVNDCITLGPNTKQELLWGCDSTYIKPQFTG